MNNNEQIVAIPCNDHAIFFDEWGVLDERIGIAWKKDKDCLEKWSDPYYISEEGWTVPAGINDHFMESPIIGHRGETIPFENLHDLFGYADDVSLIIPHLKRFDVRVDKSNMTGSLKVFMDRFFCTNEDECSTYELTVETDNGVLVMSLFKSLRFTKLGLKDKDEDILGRLREYLVPFLIEYSRLIGSKVDFGIFFRKSTSSSALQRQEQNRIICKEERMYLGPIRKFVKNKFEELWSKVLDEERQEKLYKEKSYEWQLIGSSKYDNDPDLME